MTEAVQHLALLPAALIALAHLRIGPFGELSGLPTMVFARAGAVATTAVAVRVDDTTITTCHARLPGCCPAPAAFVVMAEATEAQWIALALVLQVEGPASRDLDWLSAMTSIGSAVTSMAMGIRCAHVLVQGGGRWLRRWLFKLILLDWRRFCLLAGRRRYDPRL